MKQATLCIPIKENKILLGNKKRGFGKNKLNGFGGKINPGETIEEAVIREIYEEISLKPALSDLKKVAELNFIFPSAMKFNQTVHVFLINSWQGNPQESEEMTFEWHEIEKIPFERMWAEDRYWLPLVLAGKKLKANFTFDNDNKTIKTREIMEL